MGLTLTNDQILEHFPALVVVVKSGGVGARPGYKAAQLHRELQPRYAGILEQRDKAVKRCTHEDAEGGRRTDEEALERELKALGTVTNTIAAHPFLVDELEGIIPKALDEGGQVPSVGQVMLSLGPLVVDTPAEG